MSRETASSSATHMAPCRPGPTWQEVVGRAGWVSQPTAGGRGRGRARAELGGARAELGGAGAELGGVGRAPPRGTAEHTVGFFCFRPRPSTHYNGRRIATLDVNPAFRWGQRLPRSVHTFPRL